MDYSGAWPRNAKLAYIHHASRITHYAFVREHAAALVSVLLVGILYLGALVAMPPDALTEHDTGAKYLQVRNLRLAPLGLDWSINYPARSLDPQLQFVPFNSKQHYVDDRGRIYLQWPIFLGLLTRIPWKVMGFWGLYVVPLLAGLGALWATYLLALEVGVPRRLAWLAVPLLGLATPVAIYSLLFFEHTLAALLVTLSLLAVVRAVRMQAISSAAWGGLLLGAAIYFRSELYVLAVVTGLVLTVWVWRAENWRPLLAWGAALIVGLVPLWLFYGVSAGSILPLHATWYFTGSESVPTGNGATQLGLPALRYIVSAGWGIIPDFLFGPEAPLSPRMPVWAEVVGLAGIGLCVVAAVSRLVRGSDSLASWRIGLLTAGLALLAVSTVSTLLSTQPYYNLHGFLLASPFVALAVWPPAGERSGSAALLYAITLLYVAVHALVISAFSGLGPISTHEWGQRYLLPAYPPLVVLGLLAVASIWARYGQDSRLRRVTLACLLVWGALAAIGAGFSVRGYAMLRDERAQVEAWLRLERSLPGREPLVTDMWWLPLNLAADFYTRPMTLAEGNVKLALLAQQMRSEGVGEFGLMTSNPAVFDGAWRNQAGGVEAEGQPQEMRGIWLQRFRFAPSP